MGEYALSLDDLFLAAALEDKEKEDTQKWAEFIDRTEGPMGKSLLKEIK